MTTTRAQIAEAGSLGLDIAILNEHERAVLELLEDIEVVDGQIRQVEAVDPLDNHPFVAQLTASPFAPPDTKGVDQNELRQLVRRGDIVASDGVFFSQEAMGLAAAEVAQLLAANPEGVTVAQIRDALGTTRKFVLPILNKLDGTGVTRRREDLRIPGPRLPKI